MCLDIASGRAAPGRALVLSACGSADSQKVGDVLATLAVLRNNCRASHSLCCFLCRYEGQIPTGWPQTTQSAEPNCREPEAAACSLSLQGDTPNSLSHEGSLVLLTISIVPWCMGGVEGPARCRASVDARGCADCSAIQCMLHAATAQAVLGIAVGDFCKADTGYEITYCLSLGRVPITPHAMRGQVILASTRGSLR
jgi:hypothetical protein